MVQAIKVSEVKAIQGELWWLILAILSWVIGVIILIIGLGINKKTYQKGTVNHLDYLPSVGDWSIIGTLIELLYFSTFGLVLKYAPWWLAKIYVILFACALFYVGFLALSAS